MMSSSVISSEGGVISIYGTGVELHVPPGALQDENLIQLKILPHHENDTPAKCFEDHSTVMVEVFPNKLTLLQPASLFLPHCLKIKSVKECDVRVFQSHHTQDQEPLWEDVTWRVQYLLSDIRCEIKIQEFCWIKYSIKGAQVEAKRLLLYAVGKKCKEDSKCVTVHVGYCLDLPHENKVGVLISM
ncbi:hypothetical protein HOLleu_02048 [Holothuria leucospilota]|uniref:ZU5 domain-containing protein n=1 Tax=Holothuria leucospilota TaxID=206669 RepID=A0A9Q1CR33_HOLLE|nr:hypothetical protein HOLleu_02048 [Holothuria leucospilota]